LLKHDFLSGAQYIINSLSAYPFLIAYISLQSLQTPTPVQHFKFILEHCWQPKLGVTKYYH